MTYTKVVIIGGGFGGLNIAKALKKAHMDILLIDKTLHTLVEAFATQFGDVESEH